MYLEQLSNLYLQTTSWILGQTPLIETKHSQIVFSWDKVCIWPFKCHPSLTELQTPAHKHFVWHDCFGDFKCARLQVPMDWLGTSNETDKTVELAVIKVEATVPVTDPAYGGAIVLNPGTTLSYQRPLLFFP
jgi:hypothetical protein